METGLVLNGKQITLTKININSHLTVRQDKLLKLLHKCLENNKPLNWDIMVKFYTKNVNENHNRSEYDWNSSKYNHRQINILDAYNNNNNIWIYELKTKIRLWFSMNIGSMVLKGSILALPVIELNN